MKSRILVIEDDYTLRVMLEDNLAAQGWEISTASDGKTGLDAACRWRADLIILDIMLPEINGYEICRYLRREGVETPVLMLTAKGQDEDVVRGLGVGADDYLVKPFALAVLYARVRALLRRISPGETEFRFEPGFTLDTTSRKLTHSGDEVALTPKEFDLLLCFLRNPGRALVREKLITDVWGAGLFITERSVDRCVKTLRRKLGAEAGKQIETIRGTGYRWNVP